MLLPEPGTGGSAVLYGRSIPSARTFVERGVNEALQASAAALLPMWRSVARIASYPRRANIARAVGTAALGAATFVHCEHPDARWYREQAEAMGFAYVASGPMVRSSYKAGEFFMAAMVDRAREEDSAAEEAHEEAHEGNMVH